MRCRHCGGDIVRWTGEWWRHALSLAMGCTGLDTFAEPEQNEQVAALANGADERRQVPGVPDDLDALRARAGGERDV